MNRTRLKREVERLGTLLEHRTRDLANTQDTLQRVRDAVCADCAGRVSKIARPLGEEARPLAVAELGVLNV